MLKKTLADGAVPTAPMGLSLAAVGVVMMVAFTMGMHVPAVMLAGLLLPNLLTMLCLRALARYLHRDARMTTRPQGLGSYFDERTQPILTALLRAVAWQQMWQLPLFSVMIAGAHGVAHFGEHWAYAASIGGWAALLGLNLHIMRLAARCASHFRATAGCGL
jgi:hypothetical protein